MRRIKPAVGYEAVGNGFAGLAVAGDETFVVGKVLSGITGLVILAKAAWQQVVAGCDNTAFHQPVRGLKEGEGNLRGSGFIEAGLLKLGYRRWVCFCRAVFCWGAVALRCRKSAISPITLERWR